MAYTVLARKYRSWTFDQLVGQEAIATTFTNAIASGRIHHGYLFCGTRGVGKTSAARILARSLNCLNRDAPSAAPCCECELCLAVAEGQDVDVIEIDAASNTGVDNIRELRSNTVFRPARARFKVYIIDEVHMLSTGAFNALLKTLEEPPEHVKFIMATTEPQKVPATIHSRCQRFDFRSISVDKIAGHFEWILGQEKIESEPGVVRRVARLANGSMRDGLSLLDQLLAMGGDRLTMAMIDDVLPTPHDETLLQLVGQLADRDAAGALASIDTALAAGYSLERLAESLAEQIRALMLIRICGPETTLVDLPGGSRDAVVDVAGRFEADAYVYMIAVLEELRRNVRYSALGRALLESAMVRLAQSTSYASVQKLLDELASGDLPAEGGSAPAASASTPPAPRAPAPTPPAATAPPAVPARSADPSAGAHAARPKAQDLAPPSTAKQAPPPPPPAQNSEPTAGRKPPVGKPASKEDVAAARSEPTVQQAMDLFGGTLVHVERVSDKPDAGGDGRASGSEADANEGRSEDAADPNGNK